MPLPVTRLVAALVLSCVAACSSELATPIPQGDGALAGGSKGTPATPDAGTSPPPTPPPGNTGSSGGAAPVVDAGAPPITFEAGAPVYPDASGGDDVDSGPTTPSPTQGALGTCGNPACATDGNECGCQATDSNGDTVQMGCQAGGECICVVNQQTTGQPFSENGACSDQSSTASQFITNCQCQ
jgi:hypothetical protein